MTSYTDKGSSATAGQYHGFDHIHIWTSNAKQAAGWYICRFGFKQIAYKGLETGSRSLCSWVIRQKNLTIVLSCPLEPVETEIGRRVLIKGDAVKDVAFEVDDARTLYKLAVDGGAVSVQPPTELKDEHGHAVIATVQTYGDTVHSFVERKNYKGVFLPGYKGVDKVDPLATLLPSPELEFVDHVVGNQPDLAMIDVTNWYTKALAFHRFWSVDDSQIHSEYSALRSIVVTDYDEKVKMPINEPAPGKKKSQIQEYVDYHGEAGVQHIALRTFDIIHSVTNLKKRGLEFIKTPTSYYDDLKKRLAKSPIKVTEDMATLQGLDILIDFDDKGYLLQIFTKPVQDRPTLFYEIIQRHNHSGFGAGNFKALFEAIERDQAERGNLTELPANPYGK